MIIMALDHVRDYFHSSAMLYDPLDLSHTSPYIYFTRWVTHFCAPTFMFLAGTSAFLVGERKTKKQLSFFLLTRGLWLVFLEITVVYFGWSFNIHFPVTALITIWALGVSMMVLSAIIFLPFKIILTIGISILLWHNLLDKIHVPGNDAKAFIWDILHDPRGLSFFGHPIFTGYPVLPWIGIITLGYCFGSFYTKGFDPVKRKKALIFIGSVAIVWFIILRAANIYGDQQFWSSQRSGFYTFLSFMDVTKYPPSFLYALITIGPGILFLAFAENMRNGFTKFVSVYGRVPMFYYLLHIYLIHLLALLAAELTGFGWRSMIVDIFPRLEGYGFPLIAVYGIWVGVILLLYPLCRWYDKYKTGHKEKWWLSYL